MSVIDPRVEFETVPQVGGTELATELEVRFAGLKTIANMALVFRTDVNGGGWDADTNYITDDLVFHNGGYWHALQSSLEVEPGSDAAYWRAFGSADGDIERVLRHDPLTTVGLSFGYTGGPVHND